VINVCCLPQSLFSYAFLNNVLNIKLSNEVGFPVVETTYFGKTCGTDCVCICEHMDTVQDTVQYLYGELVALDCSLE
jgi:hypothetical protein